jgi:hypothetical protein
VVAFVGSTWVVVLRCRVCDELFTVKGIPAVRLVHAPDERACPRCGNLPGKNTAVFPRPGRSHTIIKLAREKPPASN